MDDRPNVLWVFGDQMRAQAMAHAGDPNLRTPHLDGLAAEGVSFPNAVAGCPWCTPFRGALLTSRYVHHAVQRTPQRLDPALPVVTDRFNEAGYRTAWFGKWHLGGHNDQAFIPRAERGRFGTWIGYENNNAQYEVHLHGHDEHGRDDDDPLAEAVEGYETDGLTDRLLHHLGDCGDRPFFAVLSVQPPHDPYVAPPEFQRRRRPEDIVLRPNVPEAFGTSERARRDLVGYYAQIENLDANVGRIMDHLRRTGLDRTTHVVFFSDHGDMHGSHGAWRKSSPYEEAVRIPCIVRPAGGADGTVAEAPMNHVDLAPTSLGLCGLGAPGWMAGTDFSHHVTGDRALRPGEPRSAYLQQCVRKRFHCIDRTWRGVRTCDGWKYVCLEGQPLLMHDLNEDPYETVNLAFDPAHRGRRAELQDELARWIDRTGDRFPLPEP